MPRASCVVQLYVLGCFITSCAYDVADLGLLGGRAQAMVGDMYLYLLELRPQRVWDRVVRLLPAVAVRLLYELSAVVR
jgi:hypothetical protein